MCGGGIRWVCTEGSTEGVVDPWFQMNKLLDPGM